MKSFSPDLMFYSMIIFFGIYIVLQIYIVHKLKIIISRLFEILFYFENVLRKFKLPVRAKPVKVRKSCQTCKYRLAYYNNNSKFPGYLYYRCQISKKKVAPNFLCKDFVFDPQTYNV